MLDSPSLCITYKALIVRYKRVPSAANLSPMSTNHGLSDELRGFVTGGEYPVRVGVISSFVFLSPVHRLLVFTFVRDVPIPLPFSPPITIYLYTGVSGRRLFVYLGGKPRTMPAICR